MPNHTKCVLRVTGPAKDVAVFRKKCHAYPQEYARSAQEQKMYEALGDKEEKPKKSLLELGGLVPVPADVLKAGYSNAGYAWCNAEWGTKWGAYDVSRFDLKKDNGSVYGVLYTFTSAWSPPVQWLKKVAKMFPKLEFELWARDEYPYAMTIYAWNGEDYSDGAKEGARKDYFEVCYGETDKKGSDV